MKLHEVIAVMHPRATEMFSGETGHGLSMDGKVIHGWKSAQDRSKSYPGVHCTSTDYP